MKIHPVGTKLSHVDEQAHRQTDMTKLTVACHNFANALKKTGQLITDGGHLEDRGRQKCFI